MPVTASIRCPVHNITKKEEEDLTVRQLMKTVTKELHDIADDALETMLFKKKLSLDAYKVYIVQLYYLYKVLEPALEKNKDHPIIGPIYFPDELNRIEALERDLTYFYGEDFMDKIECVPGMAEYVEHINDLSENNPALLVPHSYVRYFGDLSGGQILAKVFKRIYSLPSDGSGVQFYDFTHLENIRNFKDLYTSRLNTLDMTPEMKQEFAEEAKKAFELNIKWIGDLDKMAAAMPNGYLAPEYQEPQKKETSTHPCAHYAAKFSKLIPDSDTSRSALLSMSLALAGFAMMVTACPWMRRSLLGTMHF